MSISISQRKRWKKNTVQYMLKTQPSQYTTETARLFGIQLTVVQKARNTFSSLRGAWPVYSSAWYGISISSQKCQSAMPLTIPTPMQLAWRVSLLLGAWRCAFQPPLDLAKSHTFLPRSMSRHEDGVDPSYIGRSVWKLVWPKSEVIWNHELACALINVRPSLSHSLL